MYIAKDGAIRKREILEAALLLFGRKGYDHTSLSAIIAEVGVTKGAFYYYFSAKEDLLDTLVKELIADEYRVLREASTDPFRSAGDIVGEFLQRFAAFRGYRPERNPDLLAILESPGNTLFRRKYLAAAEEALLPLLSDVIRRGKRDGLFDTDFPDRTTALILSILLQFRGKLLRMGNAPDADSGTGESPSGASPAEAPSSGSSPDTRFLQDAVERLLGADRGSLDIAARFDRLFPAQSA